MSGNIAFIFDTNFIIQNCDLEAVVKSLNEYGYSVYVTQVAINERIAQECIKQKAKYDKLDNLKKEIKGFASIKITKPYPEMEKTYKDGMNRNYTKLFGSNIIPLVADVPTFERVLERAYMKVPPFIAAGTDKGFKDSLMWLSILEYFSEHGEDNVIFVSSDNGFKENNACLCQEFQNQTGKTIEIKDNSYYKEILEVKSEKKQSIKQEELPKVGQQLKDRIAMVLNALCCVEAEDYWGQTFWKRTFTTSKPFDAD